MALSCRRSRQEVLKRRLQHPIAARVTLTLADDLMPLIIAKATMAHAASRHPVMMGLNSPDSSMEFVMFRAFRNQK